MITETKTDFSVEVVRVGPMEKHPNADSLSIVYALGLPVVVRTDDFKSGDLAVYVPVDALVDVTRKEFAFLSSRRIKAARLRGIYSQGLLVPLEFAAEEGENVQERLGIEKYVPASERALLEHVGKTVARRLSKVGAFMPFYGLDPLKRNPNVLKDGEQVVITEKVHGCQARYSYKSGRLYVSSHRVSRGASPGLLTRVWRRILATFSARRGGDLISSAGDVWWEIAKQYGLEEKLSAHPNMVLYGEIYGERVQVGFPYDSAVGRKFVAFDVFDIKANKFLDYTEFLFFCMNLNIPVAPLLYSGPWGEIHGQHANGKTVLGHGAHIREGCVIKPKTERQDPHVGRVALKLVSEKYHLLRAKEEEDAV